MAAQCCLGKKTAETPQASKQFGFIVFNSLGKRQSELTQK